LLLLFICFAPKNGSPQLPIQSKFLPLFLVANGIKINGDKNTHYLLYPVRFHLFYDSRNSASFFLFGLSRTEKRLSLHFLFPLLPIVPYAFPYGPSPSKNRFGQSFYKKSECASQVMQSVPKRILILWTMGNGSLVRGLWNLACFYPWKNQ
jgi:hypothetical protein